MAVQSNYGTGRRKSAVARVYIKLGKGDIIVNGKPVVEYDGVHPAEERNGQLKLETGVHSLEPRR